MIALFAVFLMLGGTGAWLLGTREGAAWVLKAISAQAGADLKYRNLQGSLWNAISMEGIEVRWHKGNAKGEKLFLSWQPLMVLTGNIAIDRLYVSNLLIQDDRPEDKEPLDLTWPKVQGVAVRLDAWIDRLEMHGIDYRRLSKTHIRISQAAASVTWRTGRFSMNNLILDTPDMQIRGTVAAGFLKPSLDADILVSPQSPLWNMDRFSLNAALMRAPDPEQVKGKISLSGMSGDVPRFDSAGRIGVTKTGVNIHELQIRETGRKGLLQAKGTAVFSSPAPQFHMTITAEHIDLSPEMHVATDISGTLTAGGTPENYRGSLDVANEGDKKHRAKFAAVFNGTQTGIHLQQIRGTLLEGTVHGQIQSSWSNGVSFNSELQVRNINPAVLTPEWSGSVNLNFAAKAHWPEQGPPEGELKGRILESSLRGKTLSGEMLAGVRAQNLFIDRFVLRGKGFDISASGDLQKRIAFQARIADLSGLVPDTAGRLSAEGWVSRSGQHFSGSVNARGNSISAGRLHMRKAEIDAYFSENQKAPVRINAEIRGLAYEALQLDAVRLQANGETSSHAVKISLKAEHAELLSELYGAYQKKIWHGKIQRISYRDALGVLTLRSPAEISVSDARFALSPLVVQGPRQEALSVQAEIARQPLSGFLRADWNQFDVARGNQWLDQVALAGSTSGNMHLTWNRGSPEGIRMQGMLSGSLAFRGKTQEEVNARLQIEWKKQGLLASFSTDLSYGSALTAKMTSSSPPTFGIPAQGEINADAKDLNLGLFTPFLPEHIELRGKGSGTMRAGWAKRGLSFLSGKVEARGTVISDGHQIGIEESSLNLTTKGGRIVSRLHLALARGGRVNGQLTFGIPPRLAFPEQGVIDAQWQDMHLGAFRPLFPEGIEVSGMLSGKMQGNVLPGGKFALSGESMLSKGIVRRRTEKGQVSADVKTASSQWSWSGEVFRGDVAVSLTEYGKVAANVALPIPARIPLAINKKAPVSIAVDADVRERGMLTSVFPGLVQESQGTVQIKSRISGTWNSPQFSGDFQLKDAGAHFLPAGIGLKDVAVRGHFARNIIAFDAFSAKSGDGNIEGAAKITMIDWGISRYEGTVSGKEFRVLYLPELQAAISPQLRFEGSPAKLSVRGDIHVPELFVYGRETSATVAPSQDVVIVDAVEKPEKKLPFALDIQVHVMLGKKVFVKTEGIDARFEGDVHVTAKSQDDIQGKGLIYVAKGAYRRYGINLDIQRGRLVFSGPITRPDLDVLALRTVGDVKAGAKVTGTPQKPEVKLYSDPRMPDTDIISYIVFGHPLGEGKEQSSALLQASGALLSKGESVVLQEKIKQSVGVDVLDIQSGDGDLSRSMLTIGKYLTPKLFISYGQSLFGEGGVFRLRYTISKRWEVETQSGREAGGDIFYRLDFK